MWLLQYIIKCNRFNPFLTVQTSVSCFIHLFVWNQFRKIDLQIYRAVYFQNIVWLIGLFTLLSLLGLPFSLKWATLNWGVIAEYLSTYLPMFYTYTYIQRERGLDWLAYEITLKIFKKIN